MNPSFFGVEAILPEFVIVSPRAYLLSMDAINRVFRSKPFSWGGGG